MDAAAFEDFIRQYERDIYSFCRYLTMDRHTADDLYQDTVLHAFRSAHKLDVDSNPKAFLFSIAAGKWKNMRRKQIRRCEATALPLEEQTAAVGSPEETAEKKALDACVRRAISDMDDRYRVPLILYYFDGRGTADIARICKLPGGTVKSRLHKGRALLRAALEKEGFTHGG